MYGKIFSSMYDGSLYGQWQAIVTFQQMIVLCNEDGIVDMTPQALAARTSIPLEIIKAGIELLEKPDSYSRTRDHDGRRIELIEAERPWGWRIINYRKYRLLVTAEQKREADRLRLSIKRAAEKKATACDTPRQDATNSDMSQTSQKIANVAQAEVEVEVVRAGAHKDPTSDPAPDAPRKRGRRLSEKTLPESWRAWAKTERPDVDPDRAWPAFCDYWAGRAGKEGVKLDWEATWRNWIRKERPTPGHKPEAPPGRSGPAWLYDGSLGKVI